MLVVCGCVPEGEAIGNGVIVPVGCGVEGKGVTVAVGRGPGGTGTLGSGVTLPLGDCAGSNCARENPRRAIASLEILRTLKVSARETAPDVVLMGREPGAEMDVACLRFGQGGCRFVRLSALAQQFTQHQPALRAIGRDGQTRP